MSGDDLLNYWKHLARSVFGFDLGEYHRAADRRFFGFVGDSRTGRLTPLFGGAGDDLVSFLNQPGLRVGVAAAGYQSAVRERLSRMPYRLDAPSRAWLASLEKDFDFFFIAGDVLREASDFVKAVTFHEACHLVEQGGIRPSAFAVEPGDGRELYDSLPDAAFRRNHTPEFCGLLARAARRMVEVGEPYADDLDVIAQAMHYEYEGDLRSVEKVIQSAGEHHVRNGNRPTFFDGDYLPKIDSMYRNQAKQGAFVVSPGEGCLVRGGYRRPCYVLSEPVYRQIRERT